MKLHIKENVQIGDRVYAPYKDKNNPSRWEFGYVRDIEEKYVCCANTDCEHIHDKLYSVLFDDQTISNGLLYVAEPQWYEN